MFKNNSSKEINKKTYYLGEKSKKLWKKNSLNLKNI